MASDWATYAAGLDGVVASAPEEGCIEATASSLLYGFLDKLAIRLKPTDGGTLVDMRSRIGKVDRGVNAKRIRGFLAELGKSVCVNSLSFRQTPITIGWAFWVISGQDVNQAIC